MGKKGRAIVAPAASAAREALARRWYAAVAPQGFVPLPPDEVRAHFARWTEQLVDALMAETFAPERARAVGEALAGLHFALPEALGKTLEVLAGGLDEAVPNAPSGAARSRLGRLLGELATGFTASMRDVILAEQELIRRAHLTERARIEGALREREARLRIIFEGAAVGIILSDATGRLVEVNPVARSMLGYSEAEMHQLTYVGLTHPDDVEESVRLYQELLRGERDTYQFEKRYVRKGGEVLWGRLTVSLSHGGAPADERLVVGMIEDITERKRAEEELVEMRRRLMAARETERLRLARDLHDGPVQDLYGVRFQLTRVGEALGAADPAATLAQAQETLLRVTGLIRDICGELRPPTLVAFGLDAAIRSHAHQFGRQHADVLVRLKLEPGRHRLEDHVRLALYRIYQEAMNNVARHAGPCEVVVRLQPAGEVAVLEVRDTGCGFVVPGQRLELAREGHLGLIGAAERAEAIGGRLAVKSAVGAGTCLRVVAPVMGVVERG